VQPNGQDRFSSLLRSTFAKLSKDALTSQAEGPDSTVMTGFCATTVFAATKEKQMKSRAFFIGINEPHTVELARRRGSNQAISGSRRSRPTICWPGPD